MKINKSYRDRYKRIGKSKWFKDAYYNKSIGEVIEYLSISQKPLDGEISKFVDEHFWELI